MRLTESLLAAAVTGIVMGAAAGCNKDAPPANSATTPPASGAPAAGQGDGKHSCKGQNGCKGQGGCKVEGKNACKGQGGCKA